jgi:NADPH:quinone reductase-like Zn-dependent oxidoreductase
LLKKNGVYLSVRYSPDIQPGDMLLLKELIEAGKIVSVIDRCYPFEQIPEAHRYVERQHKRGNVVVTVEGAL